MNILLLGQSGQVGWELQRSLAVLGRVTALDVHSTTHCGDFSNPEGVRETVRALRPNVIVNAAAHTAVDRAESEPALAHLLNATTPGVLAQEAARCGAWLVHYSTDYVFDGSGATPWVETDAPAPLSVYGRTKYEGERLIEQSGCQYLIFRTSWVYAARGGNFAKTMLRLAQERTRLTVIDDQWGSPTGADLLADITAHAITHVQRRPQDGGLYHCAASGQTSWFSYAQFVLDQARSLPHAPPFMVNEIVPVATSDFPSAAQRPHNSRLNCSKLQNTLGLTLPAWQQGVARMLHEIV